MKPGFQTLLILSSLPGAETYELHARLIYRRPTGEELAVPRGFRTDLASVPRIFRSIVDNDGEVSAAAVLHDWLYSEQEFPRRECDAIFLEALALSDVGALKRGIMWLAVRAFGWSAWARRS
jgi:hypothetical protein